MIQNLLKYQDKEKEKIKLLVALDGSKVKRELDDAVRTSNAVKQAVLTLDAEAKTIATHIDTVRKNMGELVARTESIIADSAKLENEDEMNSALVYSQTIADKLLGYERQLVDLSKKINEKTIEFEDARAKLVRATKVVQTLEPEFAKQKEKIAPEIKRIEDELVVLSKDVDAKLLERYKKARTTERGNKDVVVTLVGERCGGCHFEMPQNLIYKISTDGYITCEECGKLIWRGNA